MTNVTIIEVQSTRAEDLGRKIKLLTPVGNDVALEKRARPCVHLGGDVLGNAHEHSVAMNSELQAALVVERHRRHLTERVLAVEHPPISARQQRVGYVPETLFDRR